MKRRSYFLVLILATFLSSCASHEPVDFSTQIKPIINAKCIACHGGVKKQGGFSLLFEEEALAKTKSGKYAIIPGDAKNSEMIRRLHLEDPEERMPYEAEKLTDDEIDLLTRWIDEGAKWGKHWAYEKVEKVDLPKKTLDWGSSPIDLFIAQKLAENELEPSEQASPTDLARRVALDVIGFPAPDSLKSVFLQEPNDKNYEQLVDKLLASPHYGEKWTSMWLDLARYADSKGYERDPERKIWQYRDWLIGAFNQDKPYDVFLTEQLAGDLLPNPTDDQLIATAFQRNSMTNDEGGTDNEEFRTMAVLDRTNTTWEGLMSTTFACVQCHSHPYDPFTHKEYYEFTAFYNNTRDNDTAEDYPLLRHLNEEQGRKLNDLRAWLDDKGSKEETEKVVKFIKTLSPARYSVIADKLVNAALIDTKWLAMRNHSSARLPDFYFKEESKMLLPLRQSADGGVFKIHLDSLDGPVIAQKITKKSNGNEIEALDLAPVSGKHDLYFTFDHPNKDIADKDRSYLSFNWFYLTNELPLKNKLFWELLEDKAPTTPIMMENTKGFERKTFVFERGNWTTKGEEVKPSVPKSLNPWPVNAPKNRLGLAQWITAKDNPLTARTMVNRVWEQIFGTGLVETLEDMGSQGADPTHRELLDYLSYQFMNEYNWSVKRLIKEILLSEVYKQSSVITKEALEKDPDNLYLARMPRTRLTAEQIRDQALFVSGSLNPELYGPPIMPYQPEGIVNSPYNGVIWKRSEGEEQYRRALYIFWKRTSPYPSMLTFDGVAREACSARRISTNTPLQALVTLNDSVYIDLAHKLTDVVWQKEKTKKERIGAAYERVCQKQISEGRLKNLEVLYDKAKAIYSKKNNLENAFDRDIPKPERNDYNAMLMVSNAILNLDETLTKN